MNAELCSWQMRLEQHFTELRRNRGSIGTARPIFGLEHGLGTADVQVLARAVRADVATRPPSRDHTLAWIVYSTELGYRYSGDEYWQTFEQETPGWTNNGDRYWIRDCYRKFQSDFGGAVPSGAWADNFSIICWPITHAILPFDLQKQLARILYELRHSFSAELLESPSSLGEFIAARSWNATSRFRNLVQETQLVGQIAAALLLQGDFGTGDLIFPPTLKRIGEDLDRSRRAREWLRGARRLARERVQVRGIRIGPREPRSVVRPEEARAEVVALGIEPRLILRPTDTNGTSWEVLLEIPDLTHLLLRFPRTRDILAGTRCVVAGMTGRPLARGRCLHGAQRVILERWPRADEVLLKYERSDPHLDYLLRTECLLRPGSLRLFRIASDDIAYEMRSLRVRPNERYIVVSTIGPIMATKHSSTVDLHCESAYGVRFNLPSVLGSDWEETIHKLGLNQAKTIEVWPAGLGAIAWDGEGHGEWLASERPCLGLCADSPVDALIASMRGSGEPSLELRPSAVGEPVFVEIPQLPVGLHTIHISARTESITQIETLGDLDVVIRIRELRPWAAGGSSHGPLLVRIDPATPTLEQLWEGQADLSIIGPANRQVKCRVLLLDRDGGTTILEKDIPPMRLPVDTETWRNNFEKHFRKMPDAQKVYDITRLCELRFKGDELGEFSIRCEREFVPLRWATQRRGQGYAVRLLDDRGNKDCPTITRLSFEKPMVELSLDLSPEYDVPPVGGLYVARARDIMAAVIAPPIVRHLEDLCCEPQISAAMRSPESVLHALEIAHLWGRAKLPGELSSAIRQRDVLLAIVGHIVQLLCGENWARAEARTGKQIAGLFDLQRAVSRRLEETEIGTTLEKMYPNLVSALCDDRVQFVTDLISRHLVCSRNPEFAETLRWLSELALRVVSDPAGVLSWAGQNLLSGLGKLMQEFPTLVRAARFLVIAIDLHLQSQAAIGELYATWRWA